MNIFRDKGDFFKSNVTLEGKKIMSDIEFLECEIEKWKRSPKRLNMLTGERYYAGMHDILRRERTAIGRDGSKEIITNIPNNRIVDNQYAKMVDQKVNYLLGKPVTIDADNSVLEAELKKILNPSFSRVLNGLGESSLNGGIAWMYVFLDKKGKIGFKCFEPYEILPFWKNSEHTELDFAVRIYETEVYEGNVPKIIEKAEIYQDNGVVRFNLRDGHLIPDDSRPFCNYIYINDAAADNVRAFGWGQVPLIPFKYNRKEIPLINRVKTIQDALNSALSDFQNGMQEDPRNTILVLKNYDGTNLQEFRHNLATYGVVKVKTVDGVDGGVDALQVQVNSQNYEVLLRLLKKALIENAMGYDAKDDRISENANQINIKSMYSDIDLDANGMETEYRASLYKLLEFIGMALKKKRIDVNSSDIEFIFNRDMIINEGEAIDNAQKSLGMLSKKTVVSQHPWISDVNRELDRIRAEGQGIGQN